MRAWTASACLVLLGCSGSGDDTPAATLTCEWLAGDNCWKAAVIEAGACVADDASDGTLSADGTSCGYATGETVSFDEPLLLPVPDGKAWHFTLQSAGSQCLRFDENGSHRLITASGETTFGGDLGGLVITCADGSKFQNSDPFALLSCDGSLSAHPGHSVAWSDTSASFSLLGGPDGAEPIWTCGK